MCQQCKQAGLQPEFETILHNEWSQLVPEFELNEVYTSSSRNYKKPVPRSSKLRAGVSNYIKPAGETARIKTAIAGGERNENTLTDLLFYARHPELGRRPLVQSQPNYTNLSKEWITVRNAIVRPALGTQVAPIAPPKIPAVPAHGAVSLAMLLRALPRKGYVIYQRPYELNIVGVRAKNAKPNSFDDTINFFYKGNDGAWQFKSCAATTDPGTYYLNNPMNADAGTAILKPGQYKNAYTIGLHRNIYEALVQRGGQVTVIRDPNRDAVLDLGGKEYTGYFGINIHKAKSSGTAQQVDQFSAGCQVFATTSDFDFLMAAGKEHAKRYGNKFTYTLLTENDITS